MLQFFIPASVIGLSPILAMTPSRRHILILGHRGLSCATCSDQCEQGASNVCCKVQLGLLCASLTQTLSLERGWRGAVPSLGSPEWEGMESAKLQETCSLRQRPEQLAALSYVGRKQVFVILSHGDLGAVCYTVSVCD